MHAIRSDYGGHGGGGGHGSHGGRGGHGGGNRNKSKRDKKQKHTRRIQRRMGPPFMEPHVDVSRWPFQFLPNAWVCTEQVVLQMGCPHCRFLPCLVFTYGYLACQYAIELVETGQASPFLCRFIAAARFVYLVCLESGLNNPFQTHLVQFHNFAPIVTMDLLPACMVAHLNAEFGCDSEPFMATVTTMNNKNNDKNNEDNQHDEKNEETDENNIAV